MRGRIVTALLSAVLAAASTNAYAAQEDAQLWTSLSASREIGGNSLVTLEGQLRLTDDASRTGQYVIRPSVGYKLNANTTASVGYAFVHTDPVGPTGSDEHRLWQQMAFRIAGDGKGVTLTGRSRLEQRWIERAPDMGWRFRQQLRMTAPLSGKVRVLAWSEIFLSLDDTSWGQKSGIDRWRNSVGLVVPLNKALTLEPAYTNQWVLRPGQDRVHHVANLSMSAKF